MLIDSHAHLDSPRYDEDRDALLARAWEAGVRTILSIGIGDGPDTMHQALDLARRYASQPGIPKIFASAGVHPHEAQLAGEAAYAKLDDLLQQPEVLACGEIGLDYYYDNSPREVQKAAFIRQMEIAAARRKPIIIHCRPSDNSTNAWDDTLEMLESHWKPTALGGILHCFTGDWSHARRAMDLGFLISFAGNLTYPKAQPLRDVAARVPIDGVLVETDAPWLAPAPHRGKRNEPALMLGTIHKLAALRGTTPNHIGEVTTSNFDRLTRRAGLRSGLQ